MNMDVTDQGTTARKVVGMEAGEVNVLIIGATGGTGRILLEKALEQGHEVTALARNPAAVAHRDYRPRVLEGNALDPEAVEAAVEGQDAVLSALGTRSRKPTTLFSASTANLVDAMKKHGVRRLVCLTGIGAGDSKGHSGFLYDRVILPFVVNNQYEDKDRQEEIVRRSGLEWVIVRPARLTNESATGEYRVFLSGDPYRATSISREDVAAFMLAQLSEDRYLHQTPVISN
jgi:putative NADH-flavin reductase